MRCRAIKYNKIHAIGISEKEKNGEENIFK